MTSFFKITPFFKMNSFFKMDRCFKSLRGFWLSALVLVCLVRTALACGFDGAIGDNLGEMHPKSVSVAFAIHDAVAAGVVPQTVLDPITPGSAGYWRAVGHLTRLHRLLSAADHQSGPSLSLLLIDSGLWTRFDPAGPRLEMAIHTVNAQPGDVVMLTSENVLVEIYEGRLPIGRALQLGLIVFDGSDSAAGRAAEWVTAALDRQRVSSGASTSLATFVPARAR